MLQVMINMATVYCVKDMVEMVRNKLMTRTTLVHHSCVILAYCHVLTILHDDYNVEGIFKVIIIEVVLFQLCCSVFYLLRCLHSSQLSLQVVPGHQILCGERRKKLLQNENFYFWS